MNARPTAVNLFWAVSRATEIARMLIEGGVDEPRAAEHLYEYAKCLEAADEDVNRAIGENGAALLEPNSRILTHCNAGSLATAFYGTALGVVYAAAAQGKVARVYADETRPVGQGARLTAWELSRVGVPVTLICDNMAASLMARGEVDAVVVGADRIAANGDTANKIGTYGVAVLARHHGIPFYVAAPTNTIDPDVAGGSGIPIEERDAERGDCRTPRRRGRVEPRLRRDARRPHHRASSRSAACSSRRTAILNCVNDKSEEDPNAHHPS